MDDQVTLVDQGQINPETNTYWWQPPLVGIDPQFKPKIVYTDLPKGWSDESDQSWFMRHWSKELDPDLLHEPETAQLDPSNIGKNTELLSRLAQHWQARSHELDTLKDNVWANNTFLKDNIRILNATLGQNNIDLAHALFSNVHSSTLCEGMQQGYQAEFWLRNFKVMMPKYARLIQDRIISLAEYLGAVSVQCPEQGGHPFYMDISDILEYAGQRLSMLGIGNLGFPVYQGGLIGIKTAAGIIDERQVSSLYIAIKIFEKFKHNKSARICDLGAGNGLVLFWLYQMGFRNLYAVDLPHISLVQAYNLAMHFGNKSVRFGYDDFSAPINILSMNEFFDQDYDLVVNSDSLPEIDIEWATKYLAHIDQHSGQFYSINQETMHKDQTNVRLRIEQDCPNLVQTSRHRFWMRPGYIEEWYQKRA